MAERPLHIGIDGRELVGRPTGVGRFLSEVLSEWAGDTAFPHRLSVFLPGDLPALAVRLGDRVQWIAGTGGGGGTWWEQTVLPREVRLAAPDVFFAPGYTAPLRLPCPFVVAIHDVSFFAHPEWFSTREGIRRRSLTKRAARGAARVITISEFSAGEIVRYLGIDRGRIDVVALGAPRPIERANRSARPPVVLYVGTLFHRRHIPDLVDGFAKVIERVPDATLVLVGDNRATPPLDPPALAARAGIPRHVQWRSYVGDEELADLYRQARAFAFLSDYEGFAMTPLEALAYGVPIVLLDTAVAREVYGDAATLVDGSPAAIAAALGALLEDEDLRFRQEIAGRRLLERYTWPQTAAAVRAVLEGAVSR